MVFDSQRRQGVLGLNKLAFSFVCMTAPKAGPQPARERRRRPSSRLAAAARQQGSKPVEPLETSTVKD
jgi:hypothetical protein